MENFLFKAIARMRIELIAVSELSREELLDNLEEAQLQLALQCLLLSDDFPH